MRQPVADGKTGPVVATASLSEPGVYVLRAYADDGVLTNSVDVRDHPGFVVRDDRPMPVRRPRLTEHSASPPLRDAQPVLHMHHGWASSGRAQKFPEATSFRIMLSSAWSATSFFSCVFSCSSAFKRFA